MQKHDSARSLSFVVAVAGAAGMALAAQPEQPAPTAGDIAEPAILKFEIRDEQGRPLPSRLSFRAPDGSRPDLFPNAGADPDNLAVRRNTVYCLSGSGEITVPPGKYTIWASRGLEYSIESFDVELAPGETAEWQTRLVREIDTSGWVSGDFHLHTLTYSGHGDSNMPERLISLIGEGVEFAVATDHNHNTDYEPILKGLGAVGQVTAVVGNEVSTPIGHFNAFPLDAGRPIPNHELTDARKLFAIIRDEQNRYGIRPIIQVNHPRWEGIDYFNQRGLDHVTGQSADPFWSDDFDTIEIFNENEGWGYFDPSDKTIYTDDETHSVLKDWYRLLNRGHRYAAVGNSDSHDVESELAGYPRNYVPSPTDDPGAIDPRDVAESLRERQVFTTIGPFVEFSVNGVRMGGETQATQNPDGSRAVQLGIRIQAASWVDCDIVKIVVNGDVVDTIEVPQTRSPERLDVDYALSVESDCWVSLCVEGDEPLEPIVHTQGRPIFPLAVINPVWVDADGDGKWTSPADQAVRAYQTGDVEALAVRAASGAPHERALLAQAVDRADDGSRSLLTTLLADSDRFVRQSALRSAERIADARLRPAVESAYEGASDDLTRTAAVRALIACGHPDAVGLVVALAESGVAGRNLQEFQGLLTGQTAWSWQVVGPFPASEGDLTDRDFGPESAPAQSAYQSLSGERSWKTFRPRPEGFVDLNKLSAGGVKQSVAYARCTVTSPDERSTLIAFGSDDGSVLSINGERIVVDTGDHSANPFAHFKKVALRAGDNEVLIKVYNGSGDFGFYFQVFDPELKFQTP